APARLEIAGEQRERLRVPIDQHRRSLADELDRLLEVLLRHFEHGDERPVREQRIEPFLVRLRLRHPDRLMPESDARVAEAISGPLLRAERRGPAELELSAIRVTDERLSGAPGGGDAQD